MSSTGFQHVTLCEPQCVGSEHVPFNAALLATARAAFPGTTLRFCAERLHLQSVQAAARDAGITDVDFHPIEVPARKVVAPRRIVSEYATVSRLLDWSGRAPLVLCSSTASTLLALKCVAESRAPTSCAAIIHGELELLVRRGRGIAPRFWLRRAFGSPFRPWLRVATLGTEIEQELLSLVPGLLGRTASMDHPCLLPRRAVHPTGGPLTFASVGMASPAKGSSVLLAAIAHARSTLARSEARFVHVGSFAYDAVRRDFAALVPVTAQPRDSIGLLDRGVFEAQLADVDYAIFAYPTDSYRLTASGALLDALAFGKPVIALRNAYFAYVDRLIPGFIDLCDDERALAARIVAAAIQGRDVAYAMRVHRLLAARHRFSPDSLAAAFRLLCQPRWLGAAGAVS